MSQRIGHVFQTVSESKRRSIEWIMTADTISTSDWTVRPTGLSVEGTGLTDTSTTIQVAGGTAGETYTVENQIRTTGTQRHKRNFLVTVQS